jgi:dienelactone hydrolase
MIQDATSQADAVVRADAVIDRIYRRKRDTFAWRMSESRPIECFPDLSEGAAETSSSQAREDLRAGRSYGGFMSSWLITQDSRFAAAVPVSPVTNQVTEHLISNIPHFVALFLADTYTNANGKYFQRSPVMYADRVKTPTLNICGALDRCTPPEEALQFHNALRENGVRSVLVTYPEEGHGVRKLPAAIDFAARVVAWFEENMPAARAKSLA